MARPREFDRTHALQCAMVAFWECGGYDQTSVSQLTEAMGISSPSLYSAFGSKRDLYDEAVELYAQRPGTPLTLALTEPTAYEFAARLLDAAIVDCTKRGQPKGCLVNTDPLLVDRRDNGRAGEPGVSRPGGQVAGRRRRPAVSGHRVRHSDAGQRS